MKHARQLFVCLTMIVSLGSLAALAIAGPLKTVRTAFLIAETTFDPVTVSDLYSNTINDAIFESML